MSLASLRPLRFVVQHLRGRYHSVEEDKPLRGTLRPGTTQVRLLRPSVEVVPAELPANTNAKTNTGEALEKHFLNTYFLLDKQFYGGE